MLAPTVDAFFGVVFAFMPVVLRGGTFAAYFEVFWHGTFCGEVVF